MEGLQFFEGVTYQTLLGYIFTILFGLFPSFDLFNWVKGKLKLDGQKAHWMVVILSMLLTAGVMYLTGELGVAGLEFKFTSIIAFGTSLYTASQIAYQRFKEKAG